MKTIQQTAFNFNQLEKSAITPSRLIYKKELINYNEKEIIFISQPFFEASLPFEFTGRKLVLTEENQNIDIPNFINNLILLNPTKSKQTILKAVTNKINKLYFKPMNSIKLTNIIDEKFMNKENLKPIDEKIKERWINPECPNKMEVYQNSRKQQSTDIINDYFENELNRATKKVTMDTISFITDLSLRTIKNHLTAEQKQLIKNQNQKIKGIPTNKINNKVKTNK